MSEFVQSVFLSSCPTDNSDMLNRFITGSNMKQNFANSQSKSTVNIDELQRNNLELQQKITLLERERLEMIDRENNLKKINEQIMEAFNTMGPDTSNKMNKEIQILEDKHQKEMQSTKEKIEFLQAQLEQEKKQNSYKVSLLENENQAQRIQAEHLKIEIQKNQHLINLQNSKYETLLKTAEAEKKALQDEIENQWKKKVEQLEIQLEKEKIDSNNQRQNMLKEMEANLENLKICHEHEKHLLWTKVNALSNEKNIVQGSCEQNQELYNELKRRNKEDRDNFMKEIEALKNKIFSLEQENLKIQHYEMLQLQHENQLKQKELVFEEERKKYIFKIKEMTVQIKKAEQVEKNLQTLIKEKDFIIEDNKKEHQKKLYLEKKKSENLQEAANKIKEDYTKKNAFVIQEILTKEEQIKKLNKEIMKQGVSISKINQSKTNMTTWLDPTLQLETVRLNSCQNQQNITSILNQETIPDMNLLSNNVPQITNSNAFLQEFAQSFGSPRNLMGNSPQQIDDKYFKIIEQQKQNWQQSLCYNQNGLGSSLSGSRIGTQNLSKQQSSPILNDTIEPILVSSYQPLNARDSSKPTLVTKEDKIQETQNESEDQSFNDEDCFEEGKIKIQNNQLQLAQSIFNSKHSSLGYIGQNVTNSMLNLNSLQALNTAPNTSRQGLSSNAQTYSNSNLDLKQNFNQNKTLSQNGSKSKFTTAVNNSQRCQTVSTAKKKQYIQQNQQENDKTANTSTNYKERKSTNSSIQCKTPNLSTTKKDISQKSYQNSQQQQLLSPNNANSSNNNAGQTFSSYFVQPLSQNISDSKDVSKRNFSYSTHSSNNVNSLNQNRVKNQASLHRNSNSNLDFKKEQASKDSSKLNQLQTTKTANKPKYSQSNQNSIQNQQIIGQEEQQLRAIQNSQTKLQIQNYGSGYMSQDYIDKQHNNQGCQINNQQMKEQSNQIKSTSSESVFSYQYNTNPTQIITQQNFQQKNSQSEQKIPLMESNRNIEESILISSNNCNSIKGNKINIRSSNMVRQAELLSHINSLLDILLKKQKEQPTQISLNPQEHNFFCQQIQSQAEEFQTEEISHLRTSVQENSIHKILMSLDKIKNRLVSSQSYGQQNQTNYYQNYGFDYSKRQEGSDVFERFYKNVYSQMSNNHQLLTEKSETCVSQQTLPNEQDIPLINPVRASDVTKTIVQQSLNFGQNQSTQSMNQYNSQSQLSNQNYQNTNNGPTIKTIQLK
ncbi:hypothetical protein TTHERM_00681720 (macronuclear) [Tetrahymena thermophila SB210]|uniref:Uncharacterized protein n=1 Tax=Tetrahymena thermophila (strain SB210) TaxID=312017 RepID=I7MB06_TETTS|nr:hypothetical protein TTHERM_00681720 [Tetrahymena thermophila SB210]EAS07066.2 hypothetical protein TTHERM_00681720 [Tetrahymena thermophila SB210]|eukprot:XP_001027308.2 hypothetical protein TTHERM_00681720 [Tetrahymena thermophila SB210]